MIMQRTLALLIAATLTLPCLAQDKPAQFATHLPISTETAAPYYRLSVPLAAYLASAHGDLRDLRVFNGSGQPVPYAQLAASGSTEEKVQRQTLRWFPLRGEAADAPAGATESKSLQVVVKQAGDGSLVEIRAQQGSSGRVAAQASAAPLRGYVLDASQITDRRAVRALELNWDKAAADFQLLDVESSDDLRNWHSLVSGVQLARLDYNGARIENRSIALNGFRDRYLRLIWRDPANAPQLTSAEVEQSSSRYLAAPLTWSAPLAASKGDSDLKPGEYRFRLAQPLPLARLRITLPPGNQLLPVEILTPGRERRHWRSLARSVAYRITDKSREWSNSEIALPGYALQEFVLRIDPRLNPLSEGPQLSFALQPAQLVFLASGTPPYTLAVGNKDAKDAALGAATLVPGFGQPGSPEIVAASVASEAVKIAAQSASSGSSPAATQTPSEEKDWKKIALWGVLVLGVLGMGAMAWQLITQMNKDKA
ncbi:DUF3999 domain-containing protein [Uliginosibacterium flavum]|uniref:DUF3999 domain-containing protein n=1 Tax=Uliginosibacterium flavum TaxID=1396831 RepID=A0ABV2TMK3_9RHOO